MITLTKTPLDSDEWCLQSLASVHGHVEVNLSPLTFACVPGISLAQVAYSNTILFAMSALVGFAQEDDWLVPVMLFLVSRLNASRYKIGRAHV